MLLDMTKSAVKPRNILLTLKEHNEKNVTTIKQVYNAMTLYRRSQRGHIIEMQQLMMLLERVMFLRWLRFNECTNMIQVFVLVSPRFS